MFRMARLVGGAPATRVGAPNRQRALHLLLALLLFGCGARSLPSTPTSAPSPVPTAPGETTTPATVAPPTLTPSQSEPPSDWTVLGPVGASASMSWSPNGEHLAVAAGPASGAAASQMVQIFTGDGALVMRLQGADELLWLDDSRFVVSTWNRRPTPGGNDWEIAVDRSGHIPASSVLITLTGDDEMPLDVDLGGGLSNGQGAVAIKVCPDCDADDPQFSVWTPSGSLSSPRSGSARRWSGDGTKLWLEHPTEEGPAARRWPEIVTWPDLETYYSDEEGGGLVPDVGWTKHAYVGDGEVVIVDLESGAETRFPAEAYGLVVWDFMGRVLVDDYDSASVYVYDVQGNLVESWPQVGNWLTASVDGTTVVSWYFDQRSGPNPLSVWRMGVLSELILPGRMVSRSPLLSADGSRLAVIVSLDGRDVILSHALAERQTVVAGGQDVS